LEDALGQVTPDSFWNLVIRAQLTDTFYRVVSNRACLDTSFISVPVDSFPIVTAMASKELVCPGELVQLTSTVSPTQMVEWTPTSGLSCTDCLSPVATISGPVTFVVNTPEANCPATAQVTINVASPPAIELPGSMTICPGDTVLLNNLPEEPLTTYLWTSEPVGFNNSSAQPEVTPTANTTYAVTATNEVCSVVATTSISVAQAQVTAGADESICNGSIAALAADAGGVLGAYEWIANDAQVVGVTQSINVSPSSSTIYRVVFTYSPANCQVSDEVSVLVNPSPVIEGLLISPEDGDVCEGSPIRISTTVNGGLPPYTFTWQQDGVVINSGMVDSIQLSLNGSDDGITYLLGVEVEDVNGCIAGPSTGQIKVLRCFDIPNAFTPDGDGTNDSFGVVQYDEANITVLDFVIYNRWGKKVFTATDSKPRWDGSVDGAPAPVDVYVYQLLVRRPDGTEERYSGEVTLLR
jgi:gliding motility-associated-like protein